jgi:Ca-activated chloride channel family protein
MFEHISFEYPYLLLLLIPFIICLKFCKAKKSRLIFPNASLFKKINSKKSYLDMILKVTIFSLLTIALASPFSQDDVVIQKDKGYEISLILDASGSMQQMDKFDIVKNIVSQFISKREHDKLGLTIFADFAYVAIPLTYDKKSILRLLNKIDVGVAGTQRTALYEALFMSSKLFKSSNAKDKIAILLTDGVDNTGTIPLDVAIRSVKKYGIKVYVIGVGGRGDYNPLVLKRIAKESGGKFFEADSIQRLQAIYDEINKLEKSEIKADKYIKKSYYFQYPLGVALLLMILYFIKRRRF